MCSPITSAVLALSIWRRASEKPGFDSATPLDVCRLQRLRIPVEASRGFLQAVRAEWASLNNPRLGFACVSEDVTGQFGLCGYFQEYDQDI